jgi:ribosome-associated heat shock protein Hsp15
VKDKDPAGEMPLAPEAQRLDAWLDVACLFKTRSAAARACENGRVDVNGARAKAHKLVRAGDGVEIGLDFGRRRIVRVAGISENSLPRAAARALYVDLTPAPSPEEIEARRYERLSRPVHGGRPDARERRSLRRLKGR